VRRGRAAAILALALGGGCGDYTPLLQVTDPSLTLVWSDEFDGAEGNPPDPAHWNFDVGGGGWGNNQLEYDTDCCNNAALDGSGHLAIVSRVEQMGANAYTSARLNTKGKFTHAFGRIEARIKLPTGQGLWPAFWALGEDIDTSPWPACGEIDIMEARGDVPGVNHGSLHGPGYSGGGALTSPYALPNMARFPDAFHLFTLDWSAAGVSFAVDGTTYEQHFPAEVVKASKVWVYDHPFYLLLNVAVGGNFSGDPGSTTVFPQTMLVDYVRAYDRKP